MGLQVLRICRSQRLDMGLKRVSWVPRYQGQCWASDHVWSMHVIYCVGVWGVPMLNRSPPRTQKT